MDKSKREAIGKIKVDFGRPEEIWLRFCQKEGESVLSGNAEGLAYIAKQILELVAKGGTGSHLHLGKGSPLDEATAELVITFEEPPLQEQTSQSS